jgi:hypothetical protein
MAMNERIRELILEAGFPKFDKMYVVSDGEELEKFAELIVRECADISDASFHNGSAGYTAILKHFGVEE